MVGGRLKNVRKRVKTLLEISDRLGPQVAKPSRNRIWKSAYTAWRVSSRPRVDDFNESLHLLGVGKEHCKKRLLATKYEVTKNKDQSVVAQFALTQKCLKSGVCIDRVLCYVDHLTCVAALNMATMPT